MYTIPAVAGGVGTICVSEAANCTGTGTGIAGSGTTGKIAVFTGASAVADSILTQSSNTITLAGDLRVTGAPGLVLGATGVDGQLVFNSSINAFKVTILPNATALAADSTLRLPTSTTGTFIVGTDPLGPLTYDPITGLVNCENCATAGGPVGSPTAVTSVNGKTGPVSINNAGPGAGNTVTINNASTTQKGIAIFNSTNFSDDGSGGINTRQNINTTANVQFGSLLLESIDTSPTVLTLGKASTSMGTIVFKNNAGTNTLTLQPSSSSTATVTIPAINGATLMAAVSGNGLTTSNGTLSLTTVLVGNGGTGATTFTSNGVLYGNGTGALQATAVSSQIGQCLISDNTLTPVWGSCAGTVGTGATLQTAYSNYTATVDGVTVTLDGTRKGILFRDATTPLGATLFAIQNNTGSTNYLNVTAAGTTITGGATLTGGTTITGLGTGAVLSNASGLLSSGKIALNSSTYVSGTLPVISGGLGINTIASGSVLYASATDTLAGLSNVGFTTGECLSINGSGMPDWGTCSGYPGSGVNLQNTYANSDTGEITLTSKPADTTKSGLIIKDNPTPLGATTNLFAVQSNGGTNYLNVRSTGTTIANGLTLSSLTTGILKTNGSGAVSSGALTISSSDFTDNLPLGNGGTTNTGTPTNGQLLIGNGSGYTLATLQAGSANISITNNAGQIIIDSPVVDGCAGCAENTLGNLTPTAINRTLLTSAWGVASDLGATTKPFSKLFLYGASTPSDQSLQITSAPTATRTVTLPNRTGNACIDVNTGVGSCGTSYILNQNATDQTGNIRITSNIQSGSLQASSLDTASAVALGIGATNTTGITIGSATNTSTLLTNQMTNNGATTYGALTINIEGGSGDIGTALTTVDKYTYIRISGNPVGPFTLPTPTNTTTGRVVYVTNMSNLDWTLQGVQLTSGWVNAYSTQGFVWTGSAWSPIGSAVKDARYIVNSTTLQTGNITVQSASAASVATTISGASGQAVNILELKNDGNSTNILAINSSGNALFGADSAQSIRVLNAAATNEVKFAAIGPNQVSVKNSSATAFKINVTTTSSSSANPIASVAGPSGGSNAGAYVMGVTFTPTKNLDVTAIGARNGANNTEVIIRRVSDNVIMGSSIVVTTGASNWVYNNVSQFTLLAGVQYTIYTNNASTYSCNTTYFTNPADMTIQDTYYLIGDYLSPTWGGSLGGVFCGEPDFSYSTTTVTSIDSFSVNTANNSTTTNGTATFKATVNGTATFNVQNAGGTSIFTVDTTNNLAVFNSNAQFATGSNRTLSVATQTTANTAGNNLTVSAATGNGTGMGGGLLLQGGAGGATNGAGGNATILGGTSTGGAGGNVILAGGTGASTGTVIVKAQTGADNTRIFAIQDAAGTDFMTADSTTRQIVVGNIGDKLRDRVDTQFSYPPSWSYGGCGGCGSSAAGTYLGLTNIANDGTEEVIVRHGYSSSPSYYYYIDTFGTGSYGKYYSGNGSSPSDIKYGDVNNDGRNDYVAVFSSSPNSIEVALNNNTTTELSFGTPATYNASGGTGAGNILAITDVTGDSYKDILISFPNSNNIFLYRNQGNGTFAYNSSYTTAASQRYGVVEDINGDSRPDIVISAGSVASVLLNNGSGGFNAKVDYSLAGTSEDLRLIDVNSDGIKDIVAVVFSSAVSVLTGNSNGTFNTKTDYATTGVLGTRIESIDINKDNRLDVIIASSNSIATLINSGSGSLTNFTIYSGNSSAIGVDIKDINNDNYPDILYVNTTQNKLYVKLNNRSGVFTQTYAFATGSSPTYVKAVKFYSGKPPDVVVLNSGTPGSSYSVFKNYFTSSQSAISLSSTEMVKSAIAVGTNSSPDILQVKDYTGTKTLINFSSEGTIALSENVTGGGLYGLGNSSMYIGGQVASGTALALNNVNVQYQSVNLSNEVNMFGAVNIQLKSDDSFRYSYNSLLISNTSLKTTSIADSSSYEYLYHYNNAESVAVADYNKDGYKDVASTNSMSNKNKISLFYNSGSGFATEQQINAGTNPTEIVAGDVNNDGYEDLVYIAAPSIYTLINNKVGGFNATQNIYNSNLLANYSATQHDIKLADMNNDGWLDIIITGVNNTDIRILINTKHPAGNSYTAYTISTGLSSSIYNFSIVDIDSDGKKDIVFIAYNPFSPSYTLSYVKNLTGTTYNAAVSIIPNANSNIATSEIIIDDVNNDGKIDIVMSGYSGPIQCAFGTGTLTFAAISTDCTDGSGSVNSTTYTNHLYFIDINNDAKKDIVAMTNMGIAHYLYDAGKYVLKNNVSTGATSYETVFADVNNDGLIDVIQPSNGVVVVNYNTYKDAGAIEISPNNFRTSQTIVTSNDSADALRVLNSTSDTALIIDGTGSLTLGGPKQVLGGGGTITSTGLANNSLVVGGQALFQNAANSTSALAVQNVAGTSLLNVNTTAGTVSVSGATSGASTALTVTNSTSTGAIAIFSDDTTAVLTIANEGSIVARNKTDSTTAFRIQNSSGLTNLFTADTTNNKIIITNLDVTGTLTVNGHIVTSGGVAPTANTTGAVCTGSTVSITGSDTAGLVTITTGTGCAAGKLATVVFGSAYGVGPKIILTPANGNSAAVKYYSENVGTSSFEVTSSSLPVDSTQYKFYYRSFE